MRFDIDRLRYAIDGMRSRIGAMDKRQVKVIAIGVPALVVLLIAFIIVLSIGGGGSTEDFEIPQAESTDFLTEIRPVISANERWGGVNILASKVEGKERILVRGSVSGQGDLDALKQRLEQASPPVDIDWQVAVVPDGG